MRPAPALTRLLPGPVVALAAALLALAAAVPALAQSDGMSRAVVEAQGETFRVDVADTPALRSRGLGGRARLGPDEGMLFVYRQKDRYAYWMKGMLIPIDIIWLDNTRVVHIEHRVQPPPEGASDYELDNYRPDAPANMVLELAAGRAEAIGLSEGDRVRVRFGAQ